MSQTMATLPDDLAQRQQQLAEFRSTHRVRSRLPEPLWAVAAELAARYGIHRTARVLHLDYVGLKKRADGRKRPSAKRTGSRSTPAFVELMAPAAATLTSCRIEVEATSGKLRLELPALAIAELTDLLRALLRH